MIATVEINGRSFDVRAPALDIREELVQEYARQLRTRPGSVAHQRVAAAIVAACVVQLRADLASLEWAKLRSDVYAFGGDVRNALFTDRKWTPVHLLEGANPLFASLAGDLFPREDEVKAAMGNSVGGGPS